MGGRLLSRGRRCRFLGRRPRGGEGLRLRDACATCVAKRALCDVKDAHVVAHDRPRREPRVFRWNDPSPAFPRPPSPLPRPLSVDPHGLRGARASGDEFDACRRRRVRNFVEIVGSLGHIGRRWHTCRATRHERANACEREDETCSVFSEGSDGSVCAHPNDAHARTFCRGWRPVWPSFRRLVGRSSSSG